MEQLYYVVCEASKDWRDIHLPEAFTSVLVQRACNINVMESMRILKKSSINLYPAQKRCFQTKQSIQMCVI